MATLTVTLPKVCTNMKQRPSPMSHKHRQSSWEHVLGVQDLKIVSIWRSCVVEMIFVALFVFSSIVICTGTPSALAPPLGVAFFHFLVLFLTLRAAIPPSDGHFNPAVTLSTVFTGIYSPVKGLMYIVAQSVGGSIGAMCARILLPVDLATHNLLAGCTYKTGATGLHANQAFLSEFIFTFVLVYLVFMVCTHPKQYESIGLERVPLFIGMVAGLNMYLSAIIAPGYNGAYMNPARCIGPALVHGGRELWSSLWVFLCAPTLASAAVGALYRLIPPDHRSRNDELLFEKKALGKHSLPVDEEQARSLSPRPAAHPDHGARDDQGSMKSVY